MRATFTCFKKDLAGAEITAKSFRVSVGHLTLRGFVIQKAGKYYAYQNECRHLPMALDFGGGTLFNHETTHLQCHSHGALYEIETGLCVQGPCQGQSLKRLELEETGEMLVISFPELPAKAAFAQKN